MAVSFLCRSFAYLTVRDRLPTILTKVIDTIHRNKNKFFEEYGEVRAVVNQLNSSCIYYEAQFVLLCVIFHTGGYPGREANNISAV